MKLPNGLRHDTGFSSVTVALIAATAALFSVECKDNCVGQPSAPEPAHVRFINASPESPPVDMIVDSAVVVSGSAFNTYSESTCCYRYIRPSHGMLSIRATGSLAPSLRSPIAFDAGGYYTVVLLNKKDSQQLLLLRDTLATPPPDSARVRFIHAVTDLPSIDISLGGKRIATGLSFGESTGYIPLHKFIPHNLGGNDTGSFDVLNGAPPHDMVFDLQNGYFAIFGRSVITIVILGEYNPNDASPLPNVAIFGDNQTSANGMGDLLLTYDFGAVRFFNAAHAATPASVDIFNSNSVGGFPPDWRSDFPDQDRVRNIGEYSVSQYLLLGLSNFDTNANGSRWVGFRVVSPYGIIGDSTAIVPFEKDHRYTIAMVGSGAPPYSFVIFRDTVSDPPAGRVAIRFFNAAPDSTSTANLSIQGGGIIYSGIGFKQVTQTTFLPAGNAIFFVQSTNGASASLSAVLVSGETYTISALGEPADTSYALKIFKK